MNFLAHLFLSENNTNIILGNFIADHIKGNKYLQYPLEIQKGIILHRKIDSFTDLHPIVKQSKRRLNKKYGHYKGIIIDIFYDYFLAKNWGNFSQIPLDIYSKNIYKLLMNNFDILPEKTKQMLPFMIKNDWLYNYQFLEGIQKVLNGMNQRTGGKSQMHLAINDLKELESVLNNDFMLFFKELRFFSDEQLLTLSY